jgi:hypothetical protein
MARQPTRSPSAAAANQLSYGRGRRQVGANNDHRFRVAFRPIMLHCNTMTDPTLNAENIASIPPVSADGDHRPEPGQVYPVANSDRWVVERPHDGPEIHEQVFFAGSQAKQRALTSAYETFGSVRFFPFVQDAAGGAPEASVSGCAQGGDARSAELANAAVSPPI